MKRLVLFVGSLLAGVFAFGFLISGVGWQEVWEPLRAFSFSHALVILFLTAGFLLAGAARWYFVVRGQGYKVSFSAIAKSYLAGFSLMFFVPIIPFASEIFRSSTLRELHGVEFGKAMASVVIDRIFEITSNLLVVIAGGVVFLFAGQGISYSAKTLGIVGFIGIWFLLLSMLYVRILQKKSIVRLLWKGDGGMQEVEKEVFDFFRVTNKFFWQGIFFSGVRALLGLVRVWVLVLFLGKGFAGVVGVMILGFYYLAVLVPIPASLGAHDALQAVGFGVLNLGAGTGTAFALIVRTVEALLAIIGLGLLFHASLRFMRNALLRIWTTKN